MASADTASNCQICHDVWLTFTDRTATRSINFGTFEEATSSQCPRHGPLVKAFTEHCLDGRSKGPRIRISQDIGISSGDEQNSVRMTESLSKLGICWGLLLGQKESSSSHPGTGRVLDPNWVDIDMVKKWKHECLVSHGSRCSNPMKIWPIKPAWLIDVEDKCLVPGHECDDYVALSYRWGDSSDTMRHIVGRENLQQPNALLNSDIDSQLAPIVWHAIRLTSAIEERYLWVDVLCIDHGDVGALKEQLNLMAAIYASAKVTIVSLDSDSQSGLVGLKGISGPRKLDQRIIPFGEEKIIVRNTGIFDLDHWSPYHERGWTYQEYKMSQRKILLKKKEMHWQCQCSAWHEELTFRTETDKYLDPRLGVVLAGFPDLDAMNHILSQYNDRHLRYEEDVLSGISGLLAVTSRAFQGGFLYGLAEMFFDRQLGWRPTWSHTELRRRTPSERFNASRSSSYALPSWSWIGWQGKTRNGYGEAARINNRQREIEETIPITEWYTSMSPNDPPSYRRKIRAIWFEKRDNFKDLTGPLPAGWTRHEAPLGQPGAESYLYPDGCGRYIFKHDSMPDNDCDSWYYPFPVADIQESTPGFTPEQTPYLFCQTKKTKLWAVQSRDNNKVNLRTETFTQIGELYLHNQQQRQAFPEATTVAENLGTMVELVPIYRSRIYSKTWNENLRRYTHPVKVEERYTVLWVEGKDRVFYRLASGWVEKGAWEGLNLEDISLILG